jgi:streptogramin lyase
MSISNKIYRIYSKINSSAVLELRTNTLKDQQFILSNISISNDFSQLINSAAKNSNFSNFPFKVGRIYDESFIINYAASGSNLIVEYTIPNLNKTFFLFGNINPITPETICSATSKNKFNELGKFQDWKKNIQDKVLFDNFRLASLVYNQPVNHLQNLVGSNVIPSNNWKAVGSVVAENGLIYCGADRTSRVVEFNPNTNEVSYVGQDLGAATAKYYGGCLAPNGKVFFMGDRVNGYQIVDTVTKESEVISTGTSGTANWTGIVCAPNGFLYAIPRTQPSFVKINPDAKTHEFIGNFVGTNKYRGACLGADGKIYCIPRSASNILVLDPSNDTTELLPESYSFLGGDKWQGGSMAPNGKIYCMPSGGIAVINGMRPVLVIDTVNDKRYLIWSKYSIANCVTGPDGNIYGQSLFMSPGFWFRINSETDSFEWFPSPFLYSLSHIGAVVGLDGAIYMTPYTDSRFYRISEKMSVDSNRVLSRFYNIA